MKKIKPYSDKVSPRMANNDHPKQLKKKDSLQEIFEQIDKMENNLAKNKNSIANSNKT